MSKRPAKSARRLAGGCYCGAVGYEVEDAFDYALNCHCSACRRTTGAAFKPIAGIAREKFRLTRGEDGLLFVGDAAATCDVHCGTCGALIHSVVRDGAYVHVPMGTLADTPGIRPTAHAFVGSKAAWYDITDDLPQYDGHIPGGG